MGRGQSLISFFKESDQSSEGKEGKANFGGVIRRDDSIKTIRRHRSGKGDSKCKKKKLERLIKISKKII